MTRRVKRDHGTHGDAGHVGDAGLLTDQGQTTTDDGTPSGSGVAELLSPCGLVGALVALPVYLLVRLLDRGSSLSAVAAGTAAGLAGNTFLQMHCANTGTAHMALGHAMVVVWCVLGVLLARRLERA